MQLAENTVVAGRFRLISLLGRGGMGSVWRATHLGLDIPCAVKFIEGELAAVPEAQARFEREAKAAAQLRSPHVVQILDHGVFEGTPYIAMELLEGEDLGKRLARVGRLSSRDLYTVMSQVCRALARAHAVGIVHRDLKPDNIFIVKDDDREIVKVLDFGIAKSQSMDLSTGNNTKTGALLGTPYYMSPEQAQGIKQVDFRTDLWALAVICFQALTGRLPFESDALGDLLVRIIVAPLPVPSQLGPVPPGFDAWWAKASSRDPRGRFESSKALSDSLALVCGVTNPGPPIESTAAAVRAVPTATTGGIGSPMARTIDPEIPKKSMGPVAAILGVVLAVAVLGGGFAIWQSQRSGPAPVQASASLSVPRNPVDTAPPSVAPPSVAPAPSILAPEPAKPAASPSASIATPAAAPAAAVLPHSNAKPSAPPPVAPPPAVVHQPAPQPAPARPPTPAGEAKPGKPGYDVGF
jgi:serine/threonine protein kinase